MAYSKNVKTAKGSTGINRKRTAAFLAENRLRPGVLETASGLQYSVIEEGNGSQPAPDATVVVHQRLTLVDGSVIEDTYRTGNQKTFPIEESIEGLWQGLQLMREGARYRFYIPPELAYGKRGTGLKIGPHATLIVDVRLYEVHNPPERG